MGPCVRGPPMTLLSPFWLFLFVPLVLSLWFWRPPTRFLFVIRLASILLVLVSLTLEVAPRATGR